MKLCAGLKSRPFAWSKVPLKAAGRPKETRWTARSTIGTVVVIPKRCVNTSDDATASLAGTVVVTRNLCEPPCGIVADAGDTEPAELAVMYVVRNEIGPLTLASVVGPALQMMAVQVPGAG